MPTVSPAKTVANSEVKKGTMSDSSGGPGAGAFDVDLILPIHNEAASIEATIRGAYEEISKFAAVRVIACEDGSKDGTPEILHRLAEMLPMKVISDEARKGYSGALMDGFRVAAAPYVLTMDSDGQMNPADFGKFWAAREEAEVLVGWRLPRRDSWPRRAMSRAFYLPYRALLGVKLHDPSCSFMLARREVIEALLAQLADPMVEGFWWEFRARVPAGGYTMKELTIEHRVRAAGETQVYRLGNLAGIARSHVPALFRLRAELRRGQSPG
jgi:glycosyltransferase involved in cell wall biosynthesis